MTSRPPSSIDSKDADSRESVPPWTRLREDIGVVVWSSFLAACFATLLFFALFDPLLLGDDQSPPYWLTSRLAGYSLGFFFFWLVCAVAAALTTYLLDTSHTRELQMHRQERE